MARRTIGKLPPRYALLLNPYLDERVSRCPKCKGLTHPRKFALFLHIDDYGPMVLGKTCKFCTPCQMVVVHEHDVRAELDHGLAAVAPEVVGKEFMVLGTVDKKAWREAMEGKGNTIDDTLKHTADFKKTYNLHVEGGGWVPAR